MRCTHKNLRCFVLWILASSFIIGELVVSPKGFPTATAISLEGEDSSAENSESVRAIEASSFDCTTVVDVPVIECEALVALYDSTNGDAWNDNGNWLITTSVGEWFGVTVTDGYVTELRLINNNMVGTLPQELEALSRIRALAFGFNELSGGIPAWLGNLTTLEDLAIGGNQLGGEIPSELGNLVNLTGLLLFSNGLTGSIPSELGQLDNLTDLHLNGNDLSGNIPPELGGMDSIQHLWMGENQLEGNIPADLGDLSELRTLQLQNNQLTGPIPSQLGNLTYLYILGLENNQLGGDVPESFTNLTELCLPGEYDCTDHGLDLGYNRLNTTGLSQTLWDFLAVKDPDWYLTQTKTISVNSVDPDAVSNDVNNEITIMGEGFENLPAVFLGETELVNVAFMSDTELKAIIPWGFAPGIYDLKVMNPNEESDTLADAISIIDGFGQFNSGGPYGGETIQLALQPGNPNMVYASMFGVGLFLSQDGGENWSIVLDHDWLVQLDFDAVNPNVLYQGADSAVLYRSEDNGTTWATISDDFPQVDGCFRSYPAAHPTTAGVVYAGIGSCAGMTFEADEGGVYYSDDYGDTWELRSTGLSNRDIQSLAFDSDGMTLIAGANDGKIFYSEDGGLNWSESIQQLDGYVVRLFINHDIEGFEVWAITSEPLLGSGGESHIYRTNGDIDHWEEMEIDVNSVGQMAFAEGKTWIASNSLYKIENDTIATVEGLSGTPSAFAINMENTQVMYLGTSHGVYKSYDGGSEWLEINQGLAALVPYAMAVSSCDPDTLYVETRSGIFKSQTGGNTWQNLGYGGGGFPGGKGILAVDQYNCERIYLSGECQGQFCISVSSNGGWDWEEKTAIIPEGYADWQAGVYAITPSPHTAGLVVAGTSLFDNDTGDFRGAFYISEDYGETWDYVLPDSEPIDRIVEVKFDTFDPDLLYAATYSTGLWRSQDRGATWEKLPFDVVSYPVGVNDIAVHPNIPDKVFVRIYNATIDNPNSELWVSEDRGDCWDPINEVFLGVDLVVSPPMPGMTFYNLFTGCYYGVCRSYDMGLTWSPAGGVPRPEILIAVTDGERSILYMGTPGGLINAAPGSSALARDEASGDMSGGGVYRFSQRMGDVLQAYLPIIIYFGN